MPKYLIKASYTAEGAQGIQSKGGRARRDAVDATVRGLGGQMESFYFGFGDADAYVLADLPDNVAAAAISLAVNASGAVAAQTVALLTVEELDEAAKRSVDYRPPGS